MPASSDVDVPDPLDGEDATGRRQRDVAVARLDEARLAEPLEGGRGPRRVAVVVPPDRTPPVSRSACRKSIRSWRSCSTTS
jgi:hypothetical protein